MKRISLQLRFPLLSSLLLTIACISLTLVINLSANKMITPEKIVLTQTLTETIFMTDIFPKTKQRDFRIESLFAILGIILIGSATTYVVVGKAIKPVKKLTEYAKIKILIL